METGEQSPAVATQTSASAVPAAEGQTVPEQGSYEEAASTLSTGTQLEENINQVRHYKQTPLGDDSEIEYADL